MKIALNVLVCPASRRQIVPWVQWHLSLGADMISIVAHQPEAIARQLAEVCRLGCDIGIIKDDSPMTLDMQRIAVSGAANRLFDGGADVVICLDDDEWLRPGFLSRMRCDDFKLDKPTHLRGYNYFELESTVGKMPWPVAMRWRNDGVGYEYAKPVVPKACWTGAYTAGCHWVQGVGQYYYFDKAIHHYTFRAGKPVYAHRRGRPDAVYRPLTDAERDERHLVYDDTMAKAITCMLVETPQPEPVLP